MSQQYYEQEFKNKIVRLHIEEGRTYKSLTEEYGVSKASITKWCSEFSEECQQKALANPDNKSMSTTSGFYAFATLEMMSDAMNKAAPTLDREDKLWKKDDLKKLLYSLD